jgi:hypothetical protein
MNLTINYKQNIVTEITRIVVIYHAYYSRCPSVKMSLCCDTDEIGHKIVAILYIWFNW